jgi:Tfp pilus assembly protein PilF
MAKEIGQEKAVEPTEPSEPRVADELVESGWHHYAQNEFDQAEEDFKKSLEITPHNADTMYALAMTQQAARRSQDAVQTFQKVIQLIDMYKEEDPVRALMLTRLANGHINRITTGDWKLDR